MAVVVSYDGELTIGRLRADRSLPEKGTPISFFLVGRNQQPLSIIITIVRGLFEDMHVLSI